MGRDRDRDREDRGHREDRDRNRDRERERAKEGSRDRNRDRQRDRDRQKDKDNIPVPDDSAPGFYPPGHQNLSSFALPKAASMAPPPKINVKAERARMIEQTLEYTDQSNPFGDSNLTQKFVWTKKIEQDIAQGKRGFDQKGSNQGSTFFLGGQPAGRQGDPSRKQDQLEQAKSKVDEIQKIRERRQERFEEQTEIERQRDQIEREKALEEARGWQQREDEFQYRQQLERAKIRKEQKRENFVDLLVIELLVVDTDGPNAAVTGQTSGEPGGGALFFDDLGKLDLSEEVLLPDMDPVDKLARLPLDKLNWLRSEIDNVDDNKHPVYWDALVTVCEAEMKQRRGEGGSGAILTGAGASAAEEGVEKDVKEILETQTIEDLTETEKEMREALEAAEENPEDDGCDVDLYTAVVERIPLYLAKKRVRYVHSEAIRRAREKGAMIRFAGGDITGAQGTAPDAPARKKVQETNLAKEGIQVVTERDEKRKREEARKAKKEAAAALAAAQGGSVTGSDKIRIKLTDEDLKGGQSPDESEEQESSEEEEIPSLSPRLQPLDKLIVKLEIDERTMTKTKLRKLQPNVDYQLITQAEEEEQRRANRARLIERYGGTVDEAGDAWVESMRKRAGTDGLDFNSYDKNTDHGLVQLERKVAYDWERKYKPRKPRYFNRVKTGFTWNKYNSTHYDSDVPPPKIVQGYRFNIFYPDLIDKQSTPKYFLERDADGEAKRDAMGIGSNEDDTVLLRFTAGPPYEDLCFKIVNKEWNENTRRGFRCVFDRGVLQLYFNFKHYTYRR